MKKITIINAYGNKNIGDGAIQESAFNFLNKLVDKKDIIFLLSVDAYRYKKNPLFCAKVVQHQLPYGYAIQTSSKPLSYTNKMYRFTKIFTISLYYTVFAKINKEFLSKKTAYSYIRAIIDADIVIGMGGGYFTSRYGLSDNFGLLLTLLPIYIAKHYHKKIIFLPLTFGPFANETHAKMTHKILANTTVFCRDKDSLKKIKKLNSKKNSVKTIYTPDLALFLDSPTKNKFGKGNNYYVITAREWLDEKKQKLYEKELSKVIQRNWDEKKLKAIFIPMAYNAIEDDDRRVAKRIRKEISNPNIFSVTHPHNSTEVQKLLCNAEFAICTRMHSALLSFIAEIPFVTIAYSPKTINFLEDFGLEDWNISIEDFTANKLKKKVDKLISKKDSEAFIQTIKNHKVNLERYKKNFRKQINYALN